MANEITLKLRITEDGNLEAIGKKAKKAAKATQQAANAADNYQKQQKGVAGATANGTKAFSKMTTGIQGGLVPAYAEIAARVFALTAAFNVLSRNNAILKLEEGLRFTGRAAGRNLTLVAEKLQDITAGAISAEAAMRSVAVGVSAGFSEQQLEGLATVARGAATALGRDMTDAMDRLTRGAAKLEPEILDELGIMVRLDQAVGDYAIRMNKAEGSLTQFERRMAFTNAIIEQGTKKFGELSDSIEPSAYDQLAAALSNISKTLVGGFSQALAPIATFLAQNTAALGGLVLAYGGLVGSSIVGGLTALSESSALGAQRTEHQAKAALKAVKPNKLLAKGFNDVAASQDRSAKALRKMQVSLDRTIRATTKDTAKLAVAKKMRNAITAEIYKQNVAQIKLNFTNALGDIQTLGLAAATKAHIATLVELQIATAGAMAQQTGLAKVGTLLSGVLTGVGATARFAGAALITILPWIALVGTLAAVAYPLIKKMFEAPSTRFTKVVEENTERFEEFAKVVDQYSSSIERAENETDAWIATLRPAAGLLQETATAVTKAFNAAKADKIIGVAQATRKLKEAQAAVASTPTSMKFSTTPGMGSGTAERDNRNRGIAEDAQEEIELLEKQFGAALRGEAIRGVVALQDSLLNMQAALEEAAGDSKTFSNAQSFLSDKLKVTKTILDGLTDGSLSPEVAAQQLRDIATSTGSAADAFDSFNDILNRVSETLGNTQQTWGKYGQLIDDLDESIKSVDAIDLEKGAIAARDKAKAILEKMGLDYGIEGPIEALKNFNNRLKAVNKGLKENEIEMAKNAIFAGGQSASLGDRSLNLLLERITLQQEAHDVAVDGTKEEQQELLVLLGLYKQYNDELFKKAGDITSDARRQGGDQLASVIGFGAEMDAFADQKGEDGKDKKDSGFKIQDVAAQASESMGPMLEQLRKLGPEGEVHSAVIGGLLQMTEAVGAFAEAGEEGGSKLQAGMMLAASAVNALGAMQAAQGRAAVAAIDKQIKAEQKRDGKSKESLAKIAQLEKKKEAMEKKNFERDKKMKMASIITSTAVGIMKAYEQGGMLGFVTGALIAAIGAAQLAVVSSSSYQGGASAAGDAGSPSKISLGKRNNTVDLAKSQSARGELAYMRGESGVGGANQFRPAFTGAKYRASGGSTAFVVGEQGPEMFVPETPGTIVPADEVQNTATPTNVSFNINTIDASGVEDLLVAQRGNIIGMIRQAANSYGQDFVEEVDTSVFTQSSGGVSRY